MTNTPAAGMEYTRPGRAALHVSRLCPGTLDELFPPIGNGGPAPEAWAW